MTVDIALTASNTPEVINENELIPAVEKALASPSLLIKLKKFFNSCTLPSVFNADH